jgi:hypothetical protein
MDSLTCSICSQPIPAEGPDGAWKLGHNAAPVTPERCCGACNDSYVIPIRLAMSIAPKLGAQKLKLLQKNIAIDKAVERLAKLMGGTKAIVEVRKTRRLK